MKKNLIGGQSLFEVLFSVAIAALVITGIISLVTTLVRNSTQSKNSDLATRYAMEASEWLREERDKDWTFVSSAVGSTKNLGSSGSTAGINGWTSSCNIVGTNFCRTIQLESVSPEIIQANITVRWTNGDVTHSTTTRTRLSKWQ